MISLSLRCMGLVVVASMLGYDDEEGICTSEGGVSGDLVVG